MRAEIVMIGTELLLGQIVDTNAAYMAETLAENGINLYRKTTVGDNPDRIREALDAALRHSDAVLTSGGLGPTEDDITRECVAELLGRPLEYRHDLFDDLKARFARFRFTMSENNKKQAYAPRGATAIDNPNGTAPGLIVEDSRGAIICMPGVPRELKAMLADSVIPYLRGKFQIAGLIHSRVLTVCGLGESRVDAAIGDLVLSESNPTVGMLASRDGVRVRITARAGTIGEADALIDRLDAAVRERLPGSVLAPGHANAQQAVDALLRARGWTLAVADASTGGCLSQRLTAAGAGSFAGALVLRAPDASGGIGQDDAAALDIGQRARVYFSADSGLGVIADDQGERTLAALVTPGDTVHWELGYWGAGALAQVRTSVMVLDKVRRHMDGG